MEGLCGSVGDCWKGLGIGSTAKCLRNWEVVGVQRMLKVSEVRVGKLQDTFGVEKRSSPNRDRVVGGTLASTYVLHPSQMSIVHNFKLEDLHQRCLELSEGLEVRGSEGQKFGCARQKMI